MLRFQDCIYPKNFIKLRCVENHDNARIMTLAPSPSQALAWTAFEAFNRGAFLIYAGQESAAARTPSLFDLDKVAWGAYPLQAFLSRLAALKKSKAQVEGQLLLLEAEPAIQAAWVHAEESLYGVFNVTAGEGQSPVQLPDGDYLDVLADQTITVSQGKTALPREAMILRFTGPAALKPIYSDLMDYSPRLD